ncbi:hypothetical protein U0070_015523, partial [Myodes glareolus]
SPKRTHTREKPYECICVGKSFLAKVLFKSIKYILERKAYECQCGIIELILERNPTNTISVLKPLHITFLSKCINGLILERNLNAVSVVKPLLSQPYSKA